MPPAAKIAHPPPVLDARIATGMLEEVRARTGVDFTAYRQPTIGRRILNRMLSLGLTDAAAYLDLLRHDGAEAGRLLERLTIKVSRFYRNAAVFDRLRTHGVPLLAAEGGAIRCWSAGCGRGEEAFTLAMLLEEAGVPGTVLGTDIDEGALAWAAQGRFAADVLAELPADLAARFLVTVAQGRGPTHALVPAVHDRVRLARHDVLAGAPPGAGAGFHLICCRNLIIYLTPDTQVLVLQHLLAPLLPGGLLCLGEAEWPAPEVERHLHAVDRALRIFRRLSHSPTDPGHVA